MLLAGLNLNRNALAPEEAEEINDDMILILFQIIQPLEIKQ